MSNESQPTKLEVQLRAVQENRFAILGDVWSELTTSVPALLEVEELELHRLLCEWTQRYPNAVYLLLKAIGHSDLAALLAPRLLRTYEFFTTDEPIKDAAECVFQVALPAVSPALRSAIFAHVPSLAEKRFKFGVDYVEVNRDANWPADRDLPPLDTIRGRKARLQTLGYRCGPQPDEWDLESQTALIAFKLDHALPDLERWDETTAEHLDLIAFGMRIM